jgi:hypothetical protein
MVRIEAEDKIKIMYSSCYKLISLAMRASSVVASKRI